MGIEADVELTKVSLDAVDIKSIKIGNEMLYLLMVVMSDRG